MWWRKQWRMGIALLLMSDYSLALGLGLSVWLSPPRQKDCEEGQGYKHCNHYELFACKEKWAIPRVGLTAACKLVSSWQLLVLICNFLTVLHFPCSRTKQWARKGVLSTVCLVKGLVTDHASAVLISGLQLSSLQCLSMASISECKDSTGNENEAD